VTAVLRRATAADAASLVALRAAMHESMGEPPGAPDAPWRAAATAWFEQWLPRTGEAAAFVADEPGVGPVACALGILEHPVPSPTNPVGARGHVSQVSTLPAYRRRGYARGCLEALLAWFEQETDVRRLDLHATADGEGLYRSLGFTPSPYPALRRRMH
jgi:GNAT superfamily N-acetyltransferase